MYKYKTHDKREESVAALLSYEELPSLDVLVKESCVVYLIVLVP